MMEKREVIRRLRLGHSIRQIHCDTGMHRTIVRKIKATAAVHDWLNSDVPVPTEEAVTTALKSTDALLKPEHPLDAYRDQLKLWLKEKHSYVVIHQLLEDELHLSESTVRRYCQKHFPSAPQSTYLRPTIPGEVMEVDFGTFGMVYDPQERRKRRCHVFSARLRHSKIAWREIVFSQDQSTFFTCHVHAFEYFGGVPERVVPDNLKAAVIKASHTDPVVNRVYHRLADHYGFVIDPCPPYTPELKGGVENDVKFIKGNFWPLYREQQKRIGNDIPSVEGMQKSLEAWGEKVALRTISGIGSRPTDLFQQEESDCLRPLPPERWKEVFWTSAKVHETWRVQVHRAYYTVPFQYIGKTVQVYISSTQVEICDNHILIATHRKARYDWEAVQDPAHNPPNVQAFLNSTREGVQRLAANIGPHVEAVVRTLLERKVIDGLKPSRAIIGLRKQYGAMRLDSACKRALFYDNLEYQTVKRILIKRMDMEQQPQEIDIDGTIFFRFSRESGYFAPEAKQQMEARS